MLMIRQSHKHLRHIYIEPMLREIVHATRSFANAINKVASKVKQAK